MTPTVRSALRGALRLGALLSISLGALSLAPVQPVMGDSNTANWSFNWLGQDPAAPTPWHPTNWSVLVHSRDVSTLDQLQPIAAQHGTDCGAPPATHTITSYNDAVFVCKQHMMTAINAEGYGVVYLTPDHTMNFDGGTSKLTFDVSTMRTSQRDWWDVWVTPWQENLVAPLQTMMPDLSGPPRDALHLLMVGEDRFVAELYHGCVPNNCSEGATDIQLPVVTADTWDSRVPPSERTRTPFELDLSANHVRFGIPSVNLWWVDTDVSMPFLQGIVQVGHHSYNPTKGDGCGPPPGVASCTANTWHWSDFAISRAGSFGILNGDAMSAHAGAETVSFPAPAPAGSFLRFLGLGGNTIKVSYNGAPPVTPQLQVQAGRQGSGLSDPSEYWNYWTPVPAGTTSVRFSGQDFWGGPWWAEGIALWSGTPVAVAGNNSGNSGQGTAAAQKPKAAPATPAPVPMLGNDHMLSPSAAKSSATNAAGQATPVSEPAHLTALAAKVPYSRFALPVAGLMVLFGLLAFGGLITYRQMHRRRRSVPKLPSP